MTKRRGGAYNPVGAVRTARSRSRRRPGERSGLWLLDPACFGRCPTGVAGCASGAVPARSTDEEPLSGWSSSTRLVLPIRAVGLTMCGLLVGPDATAAGLWTGRSGGERGWFVAILVPASNWTVASAGSDAEALTGPRRRGENGSRATQSSCFSPAAVRGSRSWTPACSGGLGEREVGGVITPCACRTVSFFFVLSTGVHACCFNTGVAKFVSRTTLWPRLKRNFTRMRGRSRLQILWMALQACRARTNARRLNTCLTRA